MLINDDGLTPNYGELVVCDMCGITYKYFVWAFGSDKHLCRKCVNKRPQSYLDNIDAIDIDSEHDIISKESWEQHLRDFPRENKRNAPRPQAHLSRSTYSRNESRMDKETIKRFKQRERSAVDVTGFR